MSTFRATLAVALMLVLTACGSISAPDYADTEPRLDLEEYFAGRTEAWGLFQDRSGKVRRRFEVTIDGYRDGDEFVLDEHFQYADGETDRRVWRLRRLDDHRYEGRADDVIGVATGELYGNAFNWRYVLALEVGERTWHVNFDDWMYLLEDDVLINRATVTKFGFTVGEVTLFFRKPDNGGE